MKTIVVIDIGSNSIRLILVRMGAHGSYKIINDIKESVRLEEGMGADQVIQETKLDHAIRTLRMFQNVIEANEPEEVYVVATEAVRAASNQTQFLERVKQETGLAVRVLTGEEEAYYDYLGVISTIDVSDALVIDIGGGSTELIWIEDRKMRERRSLPFGSISLSHRFQLENTITTSQENAIRAFLAETFSQIPWVVERKHKILVGVGGTMRALGKMDRKRKNYPLDTAHDYRMNAEDLHEIFDMVADKNLVQRREINGLSRDRADIIVGASAVADVLASVSGAEEVYISGAGLREGFVFSHLIQGGCPIIDVLDNSISNNMAHYGLNRKHAAHVYRNCWSLFEQLAPVHGLGSGYEKILKTAAMLHDCGINLRYYGHDKFSFFLVVNSEIFGLTHRETVLAAYVMAAFNKEKYKPDLSLYKGLVHKQDESMIFKLGILLRISRSLDRSMNGIIERIDCDVQKDAVILKVTARDNPEFEIREAIKWNTSFKRIFKKNLYIVQV
ncbi:MAG: exopolyphosphatase [Solirubrobacterales bacterium]